MPFELLDKLIAFPGFAFGLTIHEFAHAWVAWKLGDSTAERQGRLTLNPLKHLDPMGTLAFLFAGFGWARPVPVNPANLRHPRRDDILVTVAGPISNLVIAALLSLVFRLLPGSGADSLAGTFRDVVLYGIQINLILCFFNLLPIFPLDGAKIVRNLLPLKLAYSFSRLEPAGPMILLGLIALGSYMPRMDIIGRLIYPPIRFFMGTLV